jgi:hypothetical protein
VMGASRDVDDNRQSRLPSPIVRNRFALIPRLRFVPCERNGVGCRTSRAFCVDAGHACPDQAGVMLRTVPSTRPRYEIRRGDATWMRAGFSRCSSRSQKCFGTTGTRACAKAGRRCRRCRRDRNPRTRVERAIVGDCARLRTNEFLRLASRRFLRFRFVLRERKAGEAGTKPDGGSPQAPQPRLRARLRRLAEF